MTYEDISLKIDNAQDKALHIAVTGLLYFFSWSVILLSMIVGVAIGIAVVIIRHGFAFLRISLAFAFSLQGKKPEPEVEDDWQDDEEENPCSVSFQQYVGAGR